MRLNVDRRNYRGVFKTVSSPYWRDGGELPINPKQESTGRFMRSQLAEIYKQDGHFAARRAWTYDNLLILYT
jgi:hypothetical protein